MAFSFPKSNPPLTVVEEFKLNNWFKWMSNFLKLYVLLSIILTYMLNQKVEFIIRITQTPKGKIRRRRRHFR